MIDTHAHLDFPQFDKDRDEVIARAFSSGVKKIINVGCDLERSRASIRLAEKYENIFASVGLHPDFFSSEDCGNQVDWVSELKKMTRSGKVVAVGEIGLDYFRISHSVEHRARGLERIKNNQKEGFITQLELARELKLPVIIHCRDSRDKNYSSESWAYADVQKIISQYPTLKFVLHCYSADLETTKNFLKNYDNVCFSFTGNITYPSPKDFAAELKRVVELIPLERIMLDTDSPFLAPAPMRGKRNEPAFVKYIAEKIASVKEINLYEAEKATDGNAVNFFGLG